MGDKDNETNPISIIKHNEDKHRELELSLVAPSRQTFAFRGVEASPIPHLVDDPDKG